MNTDIKCYDLFWKLYKSNANFKETIDYGFKNCTIRFFNDEEWNKINAQNFVSPILEMKEFTDMFTLGYNIGNCVGTSRQLSYSYDDVDIVSGILPILKGSLNAEKEGGHSWLERSNVIIDTTLMLVINKDLKDKFGYIEEERITSSMLSKMRNYQARKEFVNDKSIKKNKSI